MPNELGTPSATAGDPDATVGPDGPGASRTHGILGVGAELGRYVVLSPLGAGAMGEVYAAYDPQLDRRVAVKIVRPGHGDPARRARARTRLLREAQALARLAHPSVVTVHDVGTIEQDVFLAMEYVQGQTLGRWLETPRSVPAIVEAFVAAGRGLAAAHTAGLVHRDFKPDNVMVGDDGRVRVMDFGLARTSDSALDLSADLGSGPDASVLEAALTRAGGRPGTPAYMSPEQHTDGRADARSDQFSFCVSLFEALYGQRPFDGESVAHLADNIVHGRRLEPPRSAGVPRWIRGVLDRGLALEPAHRFASMTELIAALQRDPRRRRRRIAIVASVVGIAALGAGGLAWSRQRARLACEAAGAEIHALYDDATAARIDDALAATGVPYVTTAQSGVRRRLDAYATQWAAVRTSVCTDGSAWPPQRRARAEDCLQQRREELTDLLQLLGDADADVARRAVEGADDLMPPPQCRDEEWLGRMARMGIPPASDASREVEAQLARARVRLRAKQFEAAQRLADAAVGDAEALDHGLLTAEARLLRGTVQQATNEFESAQRDLEAAFFGAVRLGDDALAARAATRLLLLVGEGLQRHDDGLRWGKHARAALVRAGRGPQLPLAALLQARATVLALRGDFAPASEAGEQAVKVLIEQLGRRHVAVAHARETVANVYFRQGETAKAFEHLDEVLEILREALGPEHPDVAGALNNLGVARLGQGEAEVARQLLGAAIEIRERVYGPDHLLVANSLSNLGQVEFRLGHFDEAIALDLRSLSIRERRLGVDHPTLAQNLSNLGASYQKAGRRPEAAAALERGLSLLEGKLGADHPEVAYALIGLAHLEDAGGDPVAAEARLRRALQIRIDRGVSAEYVAGTRIDLAQLLWRDASRRPEALSLLQDARDELVGTPGTDELARVEAWIRDGTPPSR
jgi:tetratricopeptide (TPR) repeat protein/predicted Ser/Thr protein kinase